MAARKGKRGGTWWNSRLDERKKKMRKLYRRQKRDPSLREEYLRSLTLYKNEVRKAREGGWRAFCSELKGIPDTSRLFKVLSKDGARATGWVKDSDGNYPSDERGNLEILLRAHLPSFSTNYPSDLLDSPRSSGRKLWSEGQEVVGKNRLD